MWDSEIITNNLRFQGQYFDQETGLHYNRYRYYSPYVGRFISKDPIGLLGGLNTFAYAPNPIIWIDPYGLSPKGTNKKKIVEMKKKLAHYLKWLKCITILIRQGIMLLIQILRNTILKYLSLTVYILLVFI
ncbi:RHS repeat-associated core domain-containing protein [Acinetobacter piscicola]|uniref:RHS repeat-associated core domain-containing protein n=1 Tax=Acinetobacter piscicola TaxID=2006115 RepID=UPI0035565A21